MTSLTIYPLLLLTLTLTFAQETPDYNKPYAPIFFDKPVYSWTDKVKIKIIAPSWNTNKDLIDSIGSEHNPIKISTRDYVLEPYRLTETDAGSGIFVGEVILTGFPHDASGDGNIDTTPRTLGNGPTSGFIETQRDSAITVSFEFADGVVLTESAPIKWNQGTINFLENSLSDKDLMVRVVDLDMNLNPESLDHIPVEVSSDSDTAGIKVDAVETAEASGIFEATISLSQNLSSSGNRLLATLDDTIYAKYEDYTLPEPHSISDSLEVQATAKLESLEPAKPTVEKLVNSKIILTNRSGNPLEEYYLNSQIQIVGVLINEQALKQSFTYIFQVEDSKGTPVSISWVQGEVAPKQILEVSQSWTPKESGDYTINTFIWESLSEAVPISQSISKSIFVQ